MPRPVIVPGTNTGFPGEPPQVLPQGPIKPAEEAAAAPGALPPGLEGLPPGTAPPQGAAPPPGTARRRRARRRRRRAEPPRRRVADPRGPTDAPAAVALARLDEITRRLRRECPWDREQDARSIVPHTVEEAGELADAANRDDTDGMLEELGDVLFQVSSWRCCSRSAARAISRPSSSA